jgi:hypothetical protein
MGVALSEDVTRWKAIHVYSEWLQARRQRRHAWNATRAAARTRGEDTPSKPESSGGDDEEEDEDGEEGEVTPPPHFAPREALSSLGDIFSRQVGIIVVTRQPKWPQIETGLSTGPTPHPRLALVCPCL